jgi:hypothetical protein
MTQTLYEICYFITILYSSCQFRSHHACQPPQLLVYQHRAWRMTIQEQQVRALDFNGGTCMNIGKLLGVGLCSRYRRTARCRILV